MAVYCENNFCTVENDKYYWGQTKGIGFNDSAPNSKLQDLEGDIISLCLDIVKNVNWKKYSH